MIMLNSNNSRTRLLKINYSRSFSFFKNSKLILKMLIQTSYLSFSMLSSNSNQCKWHLLKCLPLNLNQDLVANSVQVLLVIARDQGLRRKIIMLTIIVVIIMIEIIIMIIMIIRNNENKHKKY